MEGGKGESWEGEGPGTTDQGRGSEPSRPWREERIREGGKGREPERVSGRERTDQARRKETGRFREGERTDRMSERVRKCATNKKREANRCDVIVAYRHQTFFLELFTLFV